LQPRGMIVRIRFGVFDRIRLTGSSAIFSMFSLCFDVNLCCLTKRLTNEKGHPETTGWPTIGAMVPLADSYDLPAALGCDLNLLLDANARVRELRPDTSGSGDFCMSSIYWSCSTGHRWRATAGTAEIRKRFGMHDLRRLREDAWRNCALACVGARLSVFLLAW
jgi:hypothetical protein